MKDDVISPLDNYSRHRANVLDTEVSYIDVGAGDPIIFLHGNPTSSYLWRNIIPHVQGMARCLAPDLVGMGQSGKPHEGSYRLVDHVQYMDDWFEAMNLANNIVLVGHDWGSVIAFHWAQRNPGRVKGIVYMEAIVRSLKWVEWPVAARDIFQGMRSSSGERMIIEKNLFIERILPGSVVRDLTDEEMDAYRRPYVENPESRRPMLVWPREIPINGDPADVVEIVDTYSKWLNTTDLPKLFVNAEPGAILTGTQRDFCRAWPNQKEITVNGTHFIQEDSPNEIGRAISDWYCTLK